MEFGFQRPVGRKTGGNPLVEPEPYPLLIFGILWQCLRPGRNSQRATAKDRKHEACAPNGCPPEVEAVIHMLKTARYSVIEMEEDFQFPLARLAYRTSLQI